MIQINCLLKEIKDKFKDTLKQQNASSFFPYIVSDSPKNMLILTLFQVSLKRMRFLILFQKYIFRP